MLRRLLILAALVALSTPAAANGPVPVPTPKATPPAPAVYNLGRCRFVGEKVDQDGTHWGLFVCENGARVFLPAPGSKLDL